MFQSAHIVYFLVERALREFTQREEALHHRVKALEKASHIEDDCDLLENFNQELQKIQAEFPAKDHDIYRQEV